MNESKEQSIGDTLSRSTRAMINSGEDYDSIIEKQRRMAKVIVTVDDLEDENKLWCLRTIIELTRRSANITFEPPARITVCYHGERPPKKLGMDAVCDAGGKLCTPNDLPEDAKHRPMLSVGRPLPSQHLPEDSQFFRTVVYQGWTGGVTKNSNPDFDAKKDGQVFPLSPLVAAALAVGYLHQHCFNVASSQLHNESVFINLLTLTQDSTIDKSSTQNLVMPEVPIWIVGLGHLGQAYCWSLICLHQLGNVKLPKLILQDDDTVSPANFSTSLLVSEGSLENRTDPLMKTDLCHTAIGKSIEESMVSVKSEMLLDSNFPKDTANMHVFCGVDNLNARRLLARRHNGVLFNAGLGGKQSGGVHDFYTLELRKMDCPVDKLPPSWHEHQHNGVEKEPTNQPATKQIIKQYGLKDSCGITDKDGALPFMGLIAACLLLSIWVNGKNSVHASATKPRTFSLINKRPFE
ncbi:MAG: ThiF family adenylyltransferase [Alphaproteobacteria bacterium]|nr:ThiF family adenylyltransferase [Alphaproteobacteria bacterium]